MTIEQVISNVFKESISLGILLILILKQGKRMEALTAQIASMQTSLGVFLEALRTRRCLADERALTNTKPQGGVS